ncbi:MAG TPA: serine/threonine-protein kinase [Polyangiaceae bacterium]
MFRLLRLLSRTAKDWQIGTDEFPRDCRPHPVLLDAPCVATANSEAVVHTLLGTDIGNYRVKRLLGSGGTSDVYLLRHRTLADTHLAMKVLRQVRLPPGSFCRPHEGFANTAADSMPSLLVERFEQEARVAAAIGSPRVVAPLDIGQLEDGTPYILMDYVRGVSLAEELATGGPLAGPLALSIAHEIAETLTLAHAKGIVHRDLKPANIMLEESGAVRLLDFGAARVSGDLRLVETTQQAILGTPGYVAPEVLAGRAADSRSDVYAVGVTLFQMLTGQLPFPIQTSFATARAMLAGPAPKVRALRPPQLEGVSAATEQIVARALDCDPRARPSIEELAQGLSKASALAPVVVAATLPTAKTWSLSVIAASAASALVLALVALQPSPLPRTAALSRGTPALNHAAESRLRVAPVATSAQLPQPPLPTAVTARAAPVDPPPPARRARSKSQPPASTRSESSQAPAESKRPVDLREPLDALEWMED